MKIPAIKKLCETYSLEQVSRAEEDILEGIVPQIEIEGIDEGEQLTHAYAAKYILEAMAGGADFKDALRDFTGKVRSSIS